MMTTDKRIEQYKKAYFSYHKKYPVIRKNGAWIYINNSPTAHRSSALPKMALHLTEMAARKLDDEIHAAKTKKEPEYFEVKYPGKWKEQIPIHTITMFLDSLYEKCQHSSFRMERYMRNFSCGGDLSDCDLSDYEKEICNHEECPHIYELESELENLGSKYDSLKTTNKKIRYENKVSKETINKLQKEKIRVEQDFERLKENSVLFSMDDIDPEPLNYSHEDEDIPF